MEDREIMGRYQAGTRNLSFPRRAETGSRAQPASYDRDTEGETVEA